jgi:hypothetical protein
MNMIQAVVTNGKIEIEPPHDIRDGETVSVMVLDSSVVDGLMSDDEIARRVRALDEFNASFSIREDGEDLSKLARSAGQDELDTLDAQADKLKRTEKDV